MKKRYSEMSMVELDQELENQKDFWRNVLKLEYLTTSQIATLVNECNENIKRRLEKMHGCSFIVDRTINSHGAHLYSMDDVDKVFGIRNLLTNKIESINKIYWNKFGFIDEIDYCFSDETFAYHLSRKEIEELIERNRKKYELIYLDGEVDNGFEKELLKNVFERRKFDHRGVNYILDDLARGTTTVVKYIKV